MEKRFVRPMIREVFMSGAKIPVVYFYTSNLEKFLHAKTVFERAGLPLNQFKSRIEPYSEDYSSGKTALLDRAIDQIRDVIGRRSLFFVEDTSLRIEAFSDERNDVPGLAVKEWFAANSFREVDKQLRKKGRNRKATVKSDIALHVPDLNSHLFFHGEISGRIATQPPTFSPSSSFPWLTPHTFNGWLVPDGAKKRLGEMDLQESWEFDFRTQALEALLDRLAEYTSITNLAGQLFVQVPKDLPTPQLSFLESQKGCLVIVGKTCAGKTTMGDYLSTIHGFKHVEASDLLPLIDSQEMQGEDRFLCAQRILAKHGPDIVARKILQIHGNAPPQGLVITGFRLIEELDTIKRSIPSAQIVLIEASDRTRYQRHLARARNGGVIGFQQFGNKERQQWSFGLLRIAEEFADVKIMNEEALDNFRRRIDILLVKKPEQSVGISYNLRPRNQNQKHQVYRCLAILRMAGGPLSCDEIEAETISTGRRIRHNNVNKVLRKIPELARRLELEGMRVRYELTPHGLAYLKFFEQSENQNEPNSES